MAIVQQKPYAAGTGANDQTSAALTLTSAATAGNVLLALVVTDKASGAFTLPVNWNRFANIADYSGEVSLQVIYKVAAGGETGVTLTWENALRFVGGWMAELSGVTVTGALSLANNSSFSNVTSLVLSSLTAAGAGDAIAIVAVDSSSAWGGLTGQPTWSNSFNNTAGQDDLSFWSDPGAPGWSVALKSVSAGSVSTTASWSGGDQAAGALIILPASGGGSPPTAPSGLTATPQAAGGVALAWTDNATTETAYQVERRLSGGSWGVLTSSLAAGSTSYTDSTASPNVAYDYRVAALNGSGLSGYATASGVTTYPGAPGLSAAAVSSSRIDVTISAPSGGATSYKLERRPSGGTFAQIASGLASGVYQDTTGLSAGTTYEYRARSTNATGDSGYSSTASATTSGGGSVPGQVTDLSATPASSSQINLSWAAVSGATSYKIRRGGVVIATGVTATSYNDTGLSSATTYSYEVCATNAAGDGAYSSTASATTSGVTPAAPTSPAATPQSSSAIRVTWTASSGATGYTVERAPSASGPWSAVVTGHAASPFDDTDLSPSTAYHYRIIATNAAGASSPSASVSATTSAAGSTITYPAGTAWSWTEADWQYVERIGTVNVTATGGVGYVCLSKDGLTYDFFSGPLVSGRLTYIASGALGSAAETSARGAAVALPTVAGGLWEIPPVYQARYTRLGHRNTAASYGLREFFPRRLVEADDMRAETITGRLIKAATIVGDHLFGTTLAALKAELGIVTLGTNGGLWQGAGTFAAPTTGLKIWNDSGVGRLATYNGGLVQVELDTTGALRAGGGNVTLNRQGLALTSFEGSVGSGASVLQWRRADGTATAEQVSTANTSTSSTQLSSRAVGSASLPRAVWTAEANGIPTTVKLTLDSGSGSGGSAEINAPLTVSGGLTVTGSGGLTVSGAISATAGISSGGAAAGFNFIDRVNSANSWAWYASGTARLWRSGVGDVLTVEGAGHTSLAGNLTTGGIVGIRNTPFGNTALFIRSLGTSNTTYGLSITDSGGSSNTFYVADNGEAYVRGNTGIRTVPETSVALSVNGATTGTTQFAFSARSSLGTSDTLFWVRNDGAAWTKGTIDVGGLNNRSDARLKVGIGPLTGALGLTLAIPAEQWVWAADPTGRTHYGPTAQAVEAVAPELVTEGLPGPGQRLRPGERGVLSYDLGGLVGLHHGSIHELNALILVLTARVAALEAAL